MKQPISGVANQQAQTTKGSPNVVDTDYGTSCERLPDVKIGIHWLIVGLISIVSSDLQVTAEPSSTFRTTVVGTEQPDSGAITHSETPESLWYDVWYEQANS